MSQSESLTVKTWRPIQNKSLCVFSLRWLGVWITWTVPDGRHHRGVWPGSALPPPAVGHDARPPPPAPPRLLIAPPPLLLQPVAGNAPRPPSLTSDPWPPPEDRTAAQPIRGGGADWWPRLSDSDTSKSEFWTQRQHVSTPSSDWRKSQGQKNHILRSLKRGNLLPLKRGYSAANPELHQTSCTDDVITIS